MIQMITAGRKRRHQSGIRNGRKWSSKTPAPMITDKSKSVERDKCRARGILMEIIIENVLQEVPVIKAMAREGKKISGMIIMRQIFSN